MIVAAAENLGEVHRVEGGEIFISHDVVSLFTNTPIEYDTTIIEGASNTPEEGK